LLIMPEVQRRGVPSPAQRLGVTRIANAWLASFHAREHPPERVQLAVFAEQVAVGERATGDVPDAHQPPLLSEPM
jgi:hypothetical protein